MTITMVLIMMRFLVMTTLAIMVMVMMKLVKGHFCLVGVSTSCTAREEIDSGNVSAQTGGGQRVRWVHFEKRPHPLESARLDGLLSTSLRTVILPCPRFFKSHIPQKGARGVGKRQKERDKVIKLGSGGASGDGGRQGAGCKKG